MREILFRGKRKDNGEWSYGSLQCFKGYSIFDTIWKNFIPVGSKTVGQYIGLRDRDGKRIFEGDILERTCSVECTRRFIIGYKDSSFMYSTPSEHRLGVGDVIDDNEYGIDVSRFKIIGNIHDNPELLEDTV